MRVGTRLWIAAVFAVFLVLGIAAALRIADERELLGDATLAEKQLSAEILTALLAQNGDASPSRMVELLSQRLGHSGGAIQVELVAPEAIADHRMQAQLARGEPAVDYVDDRTIVIYTPILREDEPRILRVIEARAPEHAFLRASLLHSAVGAVSLALVLALMLWAITKRIVGVPLSHLAESTRRIAAGDLSVRAPEHGGSELSDFARELNRMTERIALARTQLDEEAAMRVMLLEQLRHAERLRMVGLLSSSFAHELGTPLNVVSGHARVIQRAEDVPQELRRRANIIIEQVSRMKDIIQNVLGFVRRKEPSREQLELGEVARHAMAMLEPMARKQSIQTSLQQDQEVWIHADRSQLLQALTNLMINAFHAMPEGGPLMLRVEQRAWSEQQPGARSGTFGCIAVQDRGVGVTAKAMPHLFEPFFTTRAQNEGTGLGLTVTNGIVQDHGGFIEVDSQPGQGSTFSLCFPLMEPSPRAAQARGVTPQV